MNIEFPCKGYRVTLRRDFTYETPEGSRTLPAATILMQEIGEPNFVAGLQPDGWRLVVGLGDYRVIPRDQIRLETLTIDITEKEAVLP